MSRNPHIVPFWLDGESHLGLSRGPSLCGKHWKPGDMVRCNDCEVAQDLALENELVEWIEIDGSLAGTVTLIWSQGVILGGRTQPREGPLWDWEGLRVPEGEPEAGKLVRPVGPDQYRYQFDQTDYAAIERRCLATMNPRWWEMKETPEDRNGTAYTMRFAGKKAARLAKQFSRRR